VGLDGREVRTACPAASTAAASSATAGADASADGRADAATDCFTIAKPGTERVGHAFTQPGTDALAGRPAFHAFDGALPPPV
jgi:hypothetical protein